MQEQTYRKLWEEGAGLLEKAGIPEAALDARLLLRPAAAQIPRPFWPTGNGR